MDFNQNAEDQTDYSYIRKTVEAAMKIHGGAHGFAFGGNSIEEWTDYLRLAANEIGANFVKIPSAAESASIEDFLMAHIQTVNNANGQPLVIAVDATENSTVDETLSPEAAMEVSNMIGRILNNSQNVVYVQMSEEGAGQFALNAVRTHTPVQTNTPNP